MNSIILDEKKLELGDLKLAAELSLAKTKFDKYIVLLKKDYGYSMTKSQFADIIIKSEQTVDRRIKEACNIPNYIRSGEGEKASYIFPIIEVAEYLTNTIKSV